MKKGEKIIKFFLSNYVFINYFLNEATPTTIHSLPNYKATINN